MLPQPRLAGGAIGAAAVAEQLLEDRARVELHRQRLRRAAPRQRVGVDAAEVAGAGAGVVGRIHRQLERGHLRVAGEVPRQQLVHRHVGDDLDFVAPAARRAGQERARGAGVNVVPVGLESRQHQHPVAERRQRLENRRQLEGRALGLRQPVVHRHPVRDVEGLEPVDRFRRGAGQDRRHRLQQRQADRRAEAPQHGAPRQALRGEKGHWDPRIRNVGLLTIPRISADQR